MHNSIRHHDVSRVRLAIQCGGEPSAHNPTRALIDKPIRGPPAAVATDSADFRHYLDLADLPSPLISLWRAGSPRVRKNSLEPCGFRIECEDQA